MLRLALLYWPVAVSLGVLAAPCSAAAQEAPTELRGRLVRVTVPSLGRTPVVGRLTEVDEDSLLIRSAGGGSHLLPLDAVTRIEWSRGRKSRIGSGARWGAVVLGAYGLLQGLTGSPGGGDWELCRSRAGCAVGAATFLGAAGALAGGCIGAFSEEEDWREVSPPPARVSLVPRGLGLAVSVRW
jgi:hypothetical protein